MLATIVMVHEDNDLLRGVTDRLKAIGQIVAPLSDSMDALTKLDAAEIVKLLITQIQFRTGTPNGIALAQMAKLKRPDIRVLFVALPEFAELTQDLGVLLQMPVPVSEVVEVAQRILAEGPYLPKDPPRRRVW